MDLGKIVAYLDDYLSRNRIRSIGPVEANALLDKAGLLKDKQGKGKPLRALLRKGFLPHAYQSSGKHSRWTISHSASRIENSIYKMEKRPIKKNEKYKIALDEIGTTDMLQLKKQYEIARTKYKPDNVKYLLIAEAPPDSIDRFFYYENVKEHDHLFLGIAQALFPELKDDFLKFRKIDREKSTHIKGLILKKFQKKEFYLLDLSELPLDLSELPRSRIKGYLKTQVPILIQKLKTVVNKNTKIILIKVDVYDIAFGLLMQAGFDVINCRIHFPAQGGQIKFQSQFNDALKLADY